MATSPSPMFDPVGYYRWLQQSQGQGTSTPPPRSILGANADAASGFANVGEQNYSDMTAELAKRRAYLEAIARGDQSISREQLRQGLAGTVGQLRSQVAGASPGNAGMAALQASNNIGRAGATMSGQAALAGLQERRDAEQALAALSLGQRGQDVNVALGSRGNAITGYTNQIQPKGPSFWDKVLGAGVGLGGAALMSDKRLKTDIEDGDKASTRLLEGLKAHVYRYKDEKYGKGKQIGILAQDLERVAPQAVINTPEGKAVDPGKLAGALAAALPTMHARIKKLEKGRK